MNEVNERVLASMRREILKVARKKRLIPYSILAARLGFDDNPGWRYLIPEYLAEINRRETSARPPRPMLTAVVITEKDGMPGPGFWDCAYYVCGVWDGNGSREDFWRKELRRVWDYWGDR
jgi:hypothetical protein